LPFGSKRGLAEEDTAKPEQPIQWEVLEGYQNADRLSAVEAIYQGATSPKDGDKMQAL